MTDAMLRDLAKNGGVCMINFFSAFLNDRVAQVIINSQKRVKSESAGGTEEMPDDATDWDLYVEWFNTLGSPQATLDDAADHVIHAAEVAGIAYPGGWSGPDGGAGRPRGFAKGARPAVLAGRVVGGGEGRRGGGEGRRGNSFSGGG